MKESKGIAWVNGQFCPLNEAVVSIEDRGFQFADGVYEVVVSYAGRPFRMADHLERLQKSLDAVGIRWNVGDSGLETVIEEGIARVGVQEMLVYVQVTRGVMPRNHVASDGLKPTIVATFKPRTARTMEQFNKGARLMTVEDFRWRRCNVKSIALLPNVLAKHEAIAAGYDDALFVSADGDIREASAANIFAFMNGELVTPPLSSAILSGVTRKYVLECAARLGLAVAEKNISFKEIGEANEVFLCSTTSEVLPIVSIDECMFKSDGANPFPQTRSLYDEFRRGITSPGKAAVTQPASVNSR